MKQNYTILSCTAKYMWSPFIYSNVFLICYMIFLSILYVNIRMYLRTSWNYCKHAGYLTSSLWVMLHLLWYLLRGNCTTDSWLLPLLISGPHVTVKAQLILNLVTDETIDPQSSGLMENNQTQSYWSLALICQLEVFLFSAEHCACSVVLSLPFVCECVCVCEREREREREGACVSKSRLQYSGFTLLYDIFFWFSRWHKIYFCTVCTKQQLAGRQQLRKLGLTSGNVLVQKQIA